MEIVGNKNEAISSLHSQTYYHQFQSDDIFM
jgi:hypothetical protein